jgi:hypothetical protein
MLLKKKSNDARVVEWTKAAYSQMNAALLENNCEVMEDVSQKAYYLLEK